MTVEAAQRGVSGAETVTVERHPMSRMHPAKVRAGIRRRWFEFRMERTPLTPCDGFIELGNPHYGGWTLPTSDRALLAVLLGRGGRESPSTST